MWKSHITYLKEAYHKYHVTRMNESYNMSKSVISHIELSHVIRGQSTCQICEWAMLHIQMSHATNMNESWHCCSQDGAMKSNVFAMSRSKKEKRTQAAAEDKASPSCVWHDSFIRVTWLIHTCDMTLVYVRDMTHSYVWYDSFICVTWLFHTGDMTLSYGWHDSCIRVTWQLHTCEYDSFLCVSWHI